MIKAFLSSLSIYALDQTARSKPIRYMLYMETLACESIYVIYNSMWIWQHACIIEAKLPSPNPAQGLWKPLAVFDHTADGTL